MTAHWWNCVLGLLCMPAEVMLGTWTVSQDPELIPLMRVNSSAEITCSTSLSNPMGLNLYRQFHGNMKVVYLSLDNGQVTRNTIAPEFEGRIHHQQMKDGHGFTLQLSLLRQEDTDLYYCSWQYFEKSLETLQSNGTMIIVREKDPQEHCRDHMFDLFLVVLIAMSVTAFSVLLLLIIGALIVRCKRFKKRFRPARVVEPPRTSRLPHVCSPQRVHHCPYLVTAVNTMDFRGIL